LLYSLYSQTVDCEVPLDRFGITPLKKTSFSSIKLEFILYDALDDKISDYQNHQTHSSENFGYYYVADLAIFEIFSGSKIVIKYFDSIDDDLIHTLLNYPFAILFNQRKKYVIHASSVIYKGKVFCFCGKSLAGKSSIAAYLINAGGFLLSEDICVFDYFNNELSILPSYNFLKLSDELSEYTNINSADPIKFLKKLTDRKGYILDQNRFSSEPMAVNYFIYPQWSAAASNLEQLNNEDSLIKLLSHEFISYSKESALQRFQTASILVTEADHYLYSREKKLNTLDHFLEIINKKLL
jgi:hypothetical protein